MDESVYCEAEVKVINFVKEMNQLTEEEFKEKYNNDISFHKGVKTLVQVFLQAEV
jgi:hypothetical protein